MELSGSFDEFGSGLQDSIGFFDQRTLRAFWEKHPKAEQPLRSWLQEMRRAEFRKPSDIRRHYRTADFIGDDRVIFNIGGNKYRLVVHTSYRRQIAFISEILSRKRRMTLPMIRKIHEEYGVPPEVLIQDYRLERTGS